MRHVLADHVATRAKIRLKRRMPGEPHFNGYLLALGDALGLMHVFHDFMPDGYVVFRVADVIGVRCGPYEHWWDHMLENEGLLDGLSLDFRPNLSDVRAAIESIAERYDAFVVECEREDDEDDDFYLGSLLSTDSDSVVLREFDGLGYWCEASAINPEDISKIQFDTPYGLLPRI